MSMLGELSKGFILTFKTLFRPNIVKMYPAEPAVLQPRFHGRHQLNRHADGLEKCVGCELCAYACPADAIFVRGGDNTPEARYSPGERYGADYQINYSRCILCGICIEACPTRALTMTNEFEISDGNRRDLIYTKDRLLVDAPTGGKDTPHTDEDVSTSNIEYYQYNFAGQSPTASRNDYAVQSDHTHKTRDAFQMGAPSPIPPPKAPVEEDEVIA